MLGFIKDKKWRERLNMILM